MTAKKGKAKRAALRPATHDEYAKLRGTSTPRKRICSICGRDYTGWGNNASPINDGRCCDECDVHYVLVRRLLDLR